MTSEKIDDVDRKIMQLRALGFHQTLIAKKLKITQPAISQRIEKIRQISKKTKDFEKIFWDLMIGNSTTKLLEIITKKK